MSDPAVTTAWVRAFIDELARMGVEHVCVAPGSRSTPLVMACAREERIRTWVHLDERCAGFFALGLAKTTRRPAAVITTSGTATANLFPAVVEASQASVPLLVLTADRPRELRGTDANQTIDQSGLYGSFVRADLDAGEPSAEALRDVRVMACASVLATLDTDPGPVHVNFPFDKPLEPAELGAEREAALRAVDPLGLDGHPDGAAVVTSAKGEGTGPTEGAVEGVIEAATEGVSLVEVREAEVPQVASAVRGAARGLIVVGPVADPQAVGPAVGDLARTTGFPVLGDPLSGARFCEDGGNQLVTTYDLFLEHPSDGLRAALEPDVVIRIGGAPVSASLLAFLGALGDVPQLRITSGHCWRDHLGVASLEVRSDEASFINALTRELSDPSQSSDPSSPSGPSAWCGRWNEVDQAARQAVCDFLASEGDALEGTVLAAVVSGVAEGSTLFVSNSMPVRDLDAFGGGGKSLRVHGNRGASGIDGIVSTVAGIATGIATGAEQGSDSPSPVVAVVGDVAFYHDMNGLLAVAKHDLDIVFVVINNDGGGIFHRLPIRDHEPEFTRYFAAPHGLDFRHAANLYGIPYQSVDQPGDAAAVLGGVLAGTGPRILEVRSDRDRNQRSREAAAEAVRQAVTALL